MVYVLSSLIKNSTSRAIIWYILKDQNGVKKKYKSNQVKDLIRQGHKVVGLAIKNNRLIQTRSTIPVMKTSKQQIITYYTGEELIDHIGTGLQNIKCERDIVGNIYGFCKSSIVNKICIVHGIRRTGKTTSLMQTIRRLISDGVSANDIGYIDIGDEVKDIKSFINKLKELRVKYLFIDEVTFIHGFDGESSYLANHLAKRMRIVVTGTDSYVFPKAQMNALYDRAVTIHSTYIPYNEYSRLFSIDNPREYMTSGGIIVKDEFNGVVKSFETLKSVVMMNIKNTLRRSNYSDDVLSSLSDEQIMYIIFNILHKTMSPKTIKKSKDLQKVGVKLSDPRVVGKNLANFLEGASGISSDEWIGIEKSIKDKLAYAKVLSALYDLDILDHIHNISNETDNVTLETTMETVCLIQGLIYSVIKACHNEVSIINGDAFENMIVSNVIMYYRRNLDANYDIGYSRYKYNGTTREVDVILRYTDLESEVYKYILIEAKHGNEFKTEMIKNLSDDSIKEALPGEHTKIIVYNGETTRYRDIQLVNAHDFLTDIGKWIRWN